MRASIKVLNSAPSKLSAPKQKLKESYSLGKRRRNYEQEEEEDDEDLRGFIVDDEEIEDEIDDPEQLKLLRKYQARKQYVYYNDAESESDYDMEANYDDIEQEEREAAILANKEDAEQLRLIQEEMRQEKLAKQKKKRMRIDD